MALHASVGLAGEDRQKCSFTMPARATKLNKHGAAVQLSRELLVGSVVTVNNKHGIELSARVVAELARLEGVSTYAIEFVEQDERAETFWGILFPRAPQTPKRGKLSEHNAVEREKLRLARW